MDNNKFIFQDIAMMIFFNFKIMILKKNMLSSRYREHSDNNQRAIIN